MIQSIEELLKFLSDTSFPRSTLMIHFDLDDFYMTGEEPYLTKGVHNLMHRPIQQVVGDCTKLVLSHQYIESGFNPLMLFKVVRGSGQGLIHSGAIANGAFLQHMELNGARLARSDFQLQFGVLKYIRYVDNLLFVLECDDCVQPLLQHLHTKLLPYTGKIEEFSGDSGDTVGILDISLRICRSTECACIGFAPILKTVGPILNWSSCHPTSIHVNWPLAFIKTLWMHSSKLDIFQAAREMFLQRFRDSFVSSDFIKFLRESTNYTRAYSYSTVQRDSDRPCPMRLL